MAITPRLQLKQSQSLLMTPQLQQAIKLLQMSNIDLAAFVENELAENPLLERDDGNNNDENNQVLETEVYDKNNNALNEDIGEIASIEFKNTELITEEKASSLDMENYENLWDSDLTASSINEVPNEDRGIALTATDTKNTISNQQFERNDYSIENNISQVVSLREHLLGQINIDFNLPSDKLVAIFLLDQLDELGRLPNKIDDFSATLGCSPKRLEDIIAKLQMLDPPGIFTRDLIECWSVQLKDVDRFDPAMEELLANIDLVRDQNYSELSSLCGVDINDVKDMIKELGTLNHRPAEAFENILVQPIIPDVLMRAGPSNSWIIELNTDTLPRVLINNQYYSRISKSVRKKEDKQYITDKFQIANWLVKSLHQRATTILKVSTEIALKQQNFFTYGVEYLKPLVLRDIAEEIEMHESTVSRVTSNKYIHTPRGIYELKYFFSAAINSSIGGDAHSAESVRYKIKSLIENELPDKILSDDKIVNFLKGNGIDIARRTVAKYRESMGISSSVQRRKEKQINI